ncbi:hypothetical protein TEQG_07382 [Trichophyton equinum CBS 127.97]|uniref:Uncharacterized protein n=1 Tax=Trichophyton equinum (strain ATCC MYA-4606 / CBS 127.97) TaxID=559882 RepID=F2Q2N1_TRIEC|nr:hypothetical protein TEQG_07382 [Trichophyton equinum CBS 127.97]
MAGAWVDNEMLSAEVSKRCTPVLVRVYRPGNLQINKGADDPTLRKLANEDSHRVIATIDIDTNQEANEENLVKFFGDIEGNVTLYLGETPAINFDQRVVRKALLKKR